MITLALLAKELGVSRPTLNKYRREGCPIDTPEAAKAWIAARQSLDSRGGRRDTPRPAGSLLGLTEAIKRANLKKTEAEAQLREMEAAQKAQNLVSMDAARAYVAEVLAPLRSLLDALPQSIGPRANPADPQLGEQAIREGLEGVFKAMDHAREAETE